jgi:hypothetical protein
MLFSSPSWASFTAQSCAIYCETGQRNTRQVIINMTLESGARDVVELLSPLRKDDFQPKNLPLSTTHIIQFWSSRAFDRRDLLLIDSVSLFR